MPTDPSHQSNFLLMPHDSSSCVAMILDNGGGAPWSKCYSLVDGCACVVGTILKVGFAAFVLIEKILNEIFFIKYNTRICSRTILRWFGRVWSVSISIASCPQMSRFQVSNLALTNLAWVGIFIRSSTQVDIYGASNIVLPCPNSKLISHQVQDFGIILRNLLGSSWHRWTYHLVLS